MSTQEQQIKTNMNQKIKVPSKQEFIKAIRFQARQGKNELDVAYQIMLNTHYQAPQTPDDMEKSIENELAVIFDNLDGLGAYTRTDAIRDIKALFEPTKTNDMGNTTLDLSELLQSLEAIIKCLCDNESGYYIPNAIDDLRKLIGLTEPASPALTPCVKPIKGDKVLIEMEVERVVYDTCYLSFNFIQKIAVDKRYCYIHTHPDSKPSPTTRLATMLKNPDDLNEVIKLAKQIEG